MRRFPGRFRRPWSSSTQSSTDARANCNRRSTTSWVRVSNSPSDLARSQAVRRAEVTWTPPRHSISSGPITTSRTESRRMAAGFTRASAVEQYCGKTGATSVAPSTQAAECSSTITRADRFWASESARDTACSGTSTGVKQCATGNSSPSSLAALSSAAGRSAGESTTGRRSVIPPWSLHCDLRVAPVTSSVGNPSEGRPVDGAASGADGSQPGLTSIQGLLCLRDPLGVAPGLRICQLLLELGDGILKLTGESL